MRPAETRHLIILLIVRVLSFPGAGRDTTEVRDSMLAVLADMRAAVRAGRTIISHGGTSYLRWHVEPGRGWKLDEVAAFPRGHRRGTVLLRTFLSLADAAHAPVRLRCPASRIAWYRRHGFRLQAPGDDPLAKAYLAAGLIQMRRPARPELTSLRDISPRAPRRYERYPLPHQVLPTAGDGVKSLVSGGRAKAGAAAVLSTVVLVGTSGCSPAVASPIYAAYNAASDLHR